MPRTATYLLISLLLSFSGSAAAAKPSQTCTAADIGPLTRHIKRPKLTLAVDGSITASACKTLPNNPQLAVATLAYADKPRAPDDSGVQQHVVALTHSADGKVVATYKEEIFEDSGTRVSSHSLWIDTAVYQLADNVRAFGIRLDAGYFGGCHCCADGGSGPKLSLFVAAANNTLSRVLADLTTNAWQNVKCNDATNGAGRIIETAAVTLAPATSRTNGYADLLITASSKLGTEGGAMAPNPKRKPMQFTVRFDGKAYDLKKYKLAFDKWWS